jgi:hypothetical protein
MKAAPPQGPQGRFSATQHTGDRSHATHARSHPNTRARRHIWAAKQRALHSKELRRQEPALRRLSVVHKPGLHRPVAPCTPVGLPELRTRRQVPPNQRPALRTESYKLVPMR